MTSPGPDDGAPNDPWVIVLTIDPVSGDLRVDCGEIPPAEALRHLGAAYDAVDGLIEDPAVTVVLDGVEITMEAVEVDPDE